MASIHRSCGSTFMIQHPPTFPNTTGTPPPQRALCRNYASNQNHRPRKDQGRVSTFLTVVACSTLSIVAAYQLLSIPYGKRQPERAGSAHGKKAYRVPAPSKFSAIANKTWELCQDYLSIVADEEKIDSLQRIDHLLSMSMDDRLNVYQREWTAIQSDEVAKTMTERNQKLLQQHFLHQQNLVRLLMCSDKLQPTDGTPSSNICSHVVGRTLSDKELEEARTIARAEFESWKKHIKQSISSTPTS